jgi:hypothetical protein
MIQDLYIKGAAASGGGSVSTKILKTGQTVTYRTGDDGDVQAGRDVDFLTLPSNNPFSNTFRFTDELGTQVYTNQIAIDWSSYNGTNSVLGYLMPFQLDGTANWNAAIDAALTKSIGTFTSGWRLTNLREIQNIFNYGVATSRLNYAPFNNTTNVNMHLSTTYANLTSQAYYITSSNGACGVFSKTSSFGGRYIACRDFTVTGTVLT